jgi:hypothetical protein
MNLLFIIYSWIYYLFMDLLFIHEFIIYYLFMNLLFIIYSWIYYLFINLLFIHEFIIYSWIYYLLFIHECNSDFTLSFLDRYQGSYHCKSASNVLMHLTDKAWWNEQENRVTESRGWVRIWLMTVIWDTQGNVAHGSQCTRTIVVL